MYESKLKRTASTSRGSFNRSLSITLPQPFDETNVAECFVQWAPRPILPSKQQRGLPAGLQWGAALIRLSGVSILIQKASQIM